MFIRSNKNKIIQPPKSSIIVKDNISLSVLKKQKYSFKLLSLFVTAFLGCFGSIYSFISLFDFKLYDAELFFYLVVFFTFFVTIFMLPKKFIFTLIPALLIYIVSIKNHWDAYINGFQLTFNRIYNRINYSDIEYYRINVKMSTRECITTFFIFSAFLLFMLICYFVIAKPNFPASFLLTFPLLEIGLFNGLAPKYIFAFMLISFWISILVMQNSSYSEHANKTDANFLRKGNNFFSKPNIKFKVSWLSSMWAVAIALSILIITNIMISVMNYERPQSIDDFRSNVKTAVEEFSFDDIQGSIERIKLSFSNSSTGGSNNGKLGQHSSLKYKNITDLVVEVSSNPYETLYLKSYVGAVYTGNSWDAISNRLYEKNSSLFDEMDKYGVYPQDFLLYNRAEFVNPFYTNYIKITPNYKRHETNYVPYYALNKNDEFTYINDTTVALEDKQEYTFTFKNMKGSYGTIDNFNNYYQYDTSYNMNVIENSYRDFVYDNYTSLPDNKSMDELREHYSNIFENSNSQYVALSKIQVALAEDAKYSLSPGKTPKNRDFVNFFLLENNEGYCTHFASAGAVLSRMAGIPTRYVTGYVVPKSEFNSSNTTEDSTYKINVKDRYAHAWVEVYLDGTGWVPYEFTPGYADGEVPEEEKKETKKPKETNAPKETEAKTTPATTKPTTKPTTSVTEQPSTSSVESASVVPKENTFKGSITITIISIIVLIILSIVFIIMKRKFMLSKMRQGFESDDKNSNIINLYSYITQLLYFTGVENSNMQYFEFADYVEENSSLLQKGEMHTIVEYVLKAGLSEHISTLDEVKFILSITKRMVYDVYNNQSWFKKLYMKYGLNLL